jgi:arsenate reductase (thioredoxin)
MDLQLDQETQNHIDHGVNELAEEFAGVFSRETIEAYVNESLEQLVGARFHDFLPLLVDRFARERLRALGQVEGMLSKDVP